MARLDNYWNEVAQVRQDVSDDPNRLSMLDWAAIVCIVVAVVMVAVRFW